MLHEFCIDLINITNYVNILYFTYVPNHPDGNIQITPQLGFLPLFYYKLDFGL